MPRDDKKRNSWNLRLIYFETAVLTIFGLAIGLYYFSRRNYLLFHTISELYSIAVAIAIFLLIINSGRLIKNYYLVFIGISYFFVSIIDLIHTLAYKGMGVFIMSPENPANIATQLWVAGRYLQSISLLVAFAIIRRKFNIRWVFVAYTLVVTILLLTIFYWHNFPLAYSPTLGLTSFKKISEVIISLIFLLSAFFLYRQREKFDRSVYFFLLLSIIITVCSELSFTLYNDVYGGFNFLGHIFKITAYFLMYWAIVIISLVRPADTIYREFMLEQEALKISEKRSKEKSRLLRIEKNERDALLSSIGDGIIAINSEQRIVYSNEAFARMIGRTKKPFKGRVLPSVADLYDEHGKLVKFENRPLGLALRDGKRVSNRSLHLLRTDGSWIDLDITGTPIIQKGEVLGGIAVWRDISEQKQIDRSKTEFISFAAHQLRTPLSTITLSLEMMAKGKVGKINSQIKTQLRDIYRDANVMSKIIDDFLNAAKVEMGIFPVVPKPEKIEEIIDNLHDEILPLAFSKKLKIVKHYEKNLPKINLDRKIVNIVIENLLTNAIKYTQEGGTIKIEAITEGANLLLKVSDSGVGVSGDQKEKIFDKMYRGKNIGGSEGAGLGLYIVKSMAEHCGGKIWLKSPAEGRKLSQENPGTTFYFMIPLRGMKKINRNNL